MEFKSLLRRIARVPGRSEDGGQGSDTLLDVGWGFSPQYEESGAIFFPGVFGFPASGVGPVFHIQKWLFGFMARPSISSGACLTVRQKHLAASCSKGVGGSGKAHSGH